MLVQVQKIGASPITSKKYLRGYSKMSMVKTLKVKNYSKEVACAVSLSKFSLAIQSALGLYMGYQAYKVAKDEVKNA